MEARELVQKDIPSLLELYKQLDSINCFIEEAKANEVWEIISKSEFIKYFGVFDGDKVVSTCYCMIIPNITHYCKNICYIENVVTDKEYRMGGLAKQVISMAIDFARENNCYKAVLLSNSKRTEAHKFYRKIGFNSESKIGFCIDI